MQRTIVVAVRVNSEEHKALKRAAEDKTLTVAAWLRMKGLEAAKE